jgi:ketosteroid isomerase-like protein
MLRAATLLCAALAAGCAQPVTQSRGLDEDAVSLADAESAFAAQSVREDMRSAFLAHFADDGLFVRGGWTPARPWLSARAAPPIILDWRPVHTEVAGSGELGLSTGPWKLVARGKPGESAAYGQFVSIWRREPGGPWKVIVDLGIGNPQPTFWEEPLEALPGIVPGRLPAGDAQEAERQFAQLAATRGMASAYERFGSPRMRLYRDDHAPAVGKPLAIALAGAATFAWTAEEAKGARSGDFAYVRGHYAGVAAAAPVLGYYLRVWRAEGGEWRIVMDVVQPAA